MRSRLQVLPFLILAFLVLLELYAYNGISVISREINETTGLFIQNIFFALLAVSAVSIGVVFFSGNRLSKAMRNFFFAFVFINLTALLVLDIFVLLDDIRRIVLWLFQANDLSRSYLLISIGVIVSGIPALLFLLGMIIGPYRYKIRPTEIALSNLPKEFDGLRIVQISDIHSGSFYNKRAVNKGVDMILNETPDLIFFTGDLVNDEAAEMNPYMSIFSRLNAPMGVYSILGNHDYGDYVQWPSKEHKAANLQRLKEVHGELGWRLLLNEHVYLEKGTEKIALIGVENWGKGFHQVGDLAKAHYQTNAPVKLLLSHDPTHWEEQVIQDYKDIDITFSGHTHGAQMGFEIGKYKWSPITLRYKKWAGLYREAQQYLYINRGFGFLGYPGRLGIWPEISVITLRAK